MGRRGEGGRMRDTFLIKLYFWSYRIMIWFLCSVSGDTFFITLFFYSRGLIYFHCKYLEVTGEEEHQSIHDAADDVGISFSRSHEPHSNTLRSLFHWQRPEQLGTSLYTMSASSQNSVKAVPSSLQPSVKAVPISLQSSFKAVPNSLQPSVKAVPISLQASVEAVPISLQAFLKVPDHYQALSCDSGTNHTDATETDIF